MDANWLTVRGNCFIEFTVDDSHRYGIFLKLFDALKLDLQKHSHLEFGVDTENQLAIELKIPKSWAEVQPSQVYNTMDDWLTVFDPSDLAFMGLPTHEDSSVQLSKWTHVPPNVTSLQEQNTDRIYSWLTDIADAVKNGDSTVPMHERMAELGKEMTTNPTMKEYQQELDNELDANPSWKRLKEFADIVDSFEEITFELETCQLIAPDHARLEFFSSGFPYGGRYVLDHLLIFYGFGNIIADNC